MIRGFDIEFRGFKFWAMVMPGPEARVDLGARTLGTGKSAAEVEDMRDRFGLIQLDRAGNPVNPNCYWQVSKSGIAIVALDGGVVETASATPGELADLRRRLFVAAVASAPPPTIPLTLR